MKRGSERKREIDRQIERLDRQTDRLSLDLWPVGFAERDKKFTDKAKSWKLLTEQENKGGRDEWIKKKKWRWEMKRVEMRKKNRMPQENSKFSFAQRFRGTNNLKQTTTGCAPLYPNLSICPLLSLPPPPSLSCSLPLPSPLPFFLLHLSNLFLTTLCVGEESDTKSASYSIIHADGDRGTRKQDSCKMGFVFI